MPAREMAINKYILKSFVKLLFRGELVSLKKSAFYFLRALLWVAIPVNWYKISSRYDPDKVARFDG